MKVNYSELKLQLSPDCYNAENYSGDSSVSEKYKGNVAGQKTKRALSKQDLPH